MGSVFVISVSSARYRRAVRVLRDRNMHNPYMVTPQDWKSDYVLAQLPASSSLEKNSIRKHMSLNIAIEDTLALCAAQNDWCFVFEDDIEHHNISQPDFDAVLERGLELGMEQGVVYLGMCIPLHCGHVDSIGGISIDKCTAYCSHAIAFHPNKANYWRTYLVNARQTRFDAVDWALLDASRSVGGFVSVGRNLASKFPDDYGLFHQNKNWPSIINA